MQQEIKTKICGEWEGVKMEIQKGFGPGDFHIRYEKEGITIDLNINAFDLSSLCDDVVNNLTTLFP